MTGALEHPLVVAYLRELDTALARLPSAAAAELSGQIRAHLLEALPPDPGEDEVRAVLAALGPARLVAADTAGKGSGLAWLLGQGRRAIAWFRQIPPSVQVTLVALVGTTAFLAGSLIYWQVQPGLQWVGSFSWWSQLDASHEVQTEAAGARQFTVPIRPGHWQGYAIFVYNPSNVTQHVLGSPFTEISPGTGDPPRISVSTTGAIRVMGEPRWVRYRLDGSIPPHAYRWVRVLWRSAHCYLNDAGSSQGSSDLLLRVRVGWLTRTEDINLGTEIAVGATAATVRADRAYCRNHPAG